MSSGYAEESENETLPSGPGKNAAQLERIRQSAAYLPTLLRSIDRGSIERALVLRFSNAATAAAEEVGLAGRFSNGEDLTLSSVVDQLRRVSGAEGLNSSEFRAWDTPLLKHALKRYVDTAHAEAAGFHKTLRAEVNRYEKTLGPKVRESIEAATESVKSSGIEQGEFLRQARAHLHDILMEPGLNQSPFWVLMSAFLKCLPNGYTQEACGELDRLMSLVESADSTVCLISFRFRALAYEALGDYDIAYGSIRRALKHSGSPLLQLEVARMAMGAGDVAAAKKLVDQLLYQQPILFPLLIAEPNFVRLDSAIVAGHARALPPERKEAAAACDEWAKTAGRILQVLESNSIVTDIDLKLLAGSVKLKEGAAGADLMESVAISTFADLSRESLIREACLKVKDQIKTADHEIQRVTTELSKAQTLFEQQVAAENAAHDRRVQGILSERIDFDGKDRVVNLGCMGAMVNAGVTFACFVGASIYFSSKGTKVDMNSPIGLGVLLVIAIPLVLSLGNQLTWSMKRAKLERAMQMKVNAAEDEFRPKLEALRAANAEDVERLTQEKLANEARHAVLEKARIELEAVTGRIDLSEDGVSPQASPQAA